MAGRWTRTVPLLVLLPIAGFAAFPLAWMALSSLKPATELYRFPPSLLPQAPGLGFYRTVLETTPFLDFLISSAVVTCCATAVSVAISAMAGYALARLRFRGRDLASGSVLLAYFFPQILLVVPLFAIVAGAGLANTYTGLVLTYVTFTFPLATWVLAAYFRTIPYEIEEAARVDGASNLGVFWRIILPLSGPGLVTASVFCAINAWNEFLYALVILGAGDKRTLTVGLYNFIGGEQAQYGPLMAASTIAMAPILLFFWLIQRRLAAGLTAGAVKG